MDYDEWIEQTGKESCLENWIEWAIDICGMKYTEALKESQDVEL